MLVSLQMGLVHSEFGGGVVPIPVVLSSGPGRCCSLTLQELGKS